MQRVAREAEGRKQGENVKVTLISQRRCGEERGNGVLLTYSFSMFI